MDPIGVLLAVAALTVFPGGAYVVATAAAAGRLGGLRWRPGGWRIAEAAGCACALAATSMAPLPGSPAESLPGGSGVSPNIAAALVLMAAALAFGTAPDWPWSRAALAVVAVPVLALAAGTSTLAFPTIVAVPGTAISMARVLTGAALLIASPLLAAPDPEGSPLARTVILAALSILALSLFLPSSLRSHPGWWTAGAVFAASVIHGAAVCRLSPLPPGRRRLVAAATLATSAAAALFAALATA